MVRQPLIFTSRYLSSSSALPPVNRLFLALIYRQTRKRVNVLFQAYLICYQIFVQLIPDIVATAILGARENGYIEEVEIEPHKTITEKVVEKRIFGLIKRTKEVERTIPPKVVNIDRMEEVKMFLRYHVPPAEINRVLAEVVANRMDATFFFAITDSLNGIRVTQPTTTTAPGQ